MGQTDGQTYMYICVIALALQIFDMKINIFYRMKLNMIFIVGFLRAETWFTLLKSYTGHIY